VLSPIGTTFQSLTAQIWRPLPFFRQTTLTDRRNGATQVETRVRQGGKR
jgi:hypothetical protein